MTEEIETGSPTKNWTTIGWILGVIPSLLLFVSGVMKFIQPAGFEEGLTHMGWRPEQMYAIGAVEILCVLIFLFPKTAVLGAILLTGYMGGAIATHVRVGDIVIVQVLIGMVFWLSLWLRDPRIRQLIPFRT